MDAHLLTGLGLIAGVCTTCSFLPQVIKAFRSHQTRDISIGMYATLSLGLCLWLVYGLLLGDMPIILTNAVSLTLALVVLGLKVRHG